MAKLVLPGLHGLCDGNSDPNLLELGLSWRLPYARVKQLVDKKVILAVRSPPAAPTIYTVLSGYVWGLQVNELSEPVFTDSGVHLILRKG